MAEGHSPVTGMPSSIATRGDSAGNNAARLGPRSCNGTRERKQCDYPGQHALRNDLHHNPDRANSAENMKPLACQMNWRIDGARQHRHDCGGREWLDSPASLQHRKSAHIVPASANIRSPIHAVELPCSRPGPAVIASPETTIARPVSRIALGRERWRCSKGYSPA
jgi:hypothetical protein